MCIRDRNYSKKPWALQPTQMISYVSCHDDMCLADRLKATMPDASVEELLSLIHIYNQGANEGREMIMQTLNRNGVDIAALAQAVNTSTDQILAGINSVSQAICGLGNQMGQNTNSCLLYTSG